MNRPSCVVIGLFPFDTANILQIFYPPKLFAKKIEKSVKNLILPLKTPPFRTPEPPQSHISPSLTTKRIRLRRCSASICLWALLTSKGVEPIERVYDRLRLLLSVSALRLRRSNPLSNIRQVPLISLTSQPATWGGVSAWDGEIATATPRNDGVEEIPHGGCGY